MVGPNGVGPNGVGPNVSEPRKCVLARNTRFIHTRVVNIGVDTVNASKYKRKTLENNFNLKK
jgi:hypothetical protein